MTSLWYQRLLRPAAMAWHRWSFNRAVRQATRPSAVTRAVLFAERYAPTWGWVVRLRFRRQLRHVSGTVAIWTLMLAMDEDEEEV